MSVVEDTEQCDQLDVENVSQEFIGLPLLDPRVEIYLQLEGIYDSDSSEEYFSDEISTDYSMDYEYSPPITNAKRGNRPQPPSMDFYKTLINQSEHPIKPVQHSTGAYSYSDNQKPLSKMQNPSSQPLSMLQRSLDAMRHVRPNSGSTIKGMHVGNDRSFPESMVGPSRPPHGGPTQSHLSNIATTTSPSKPLTSIPTQSLQSAFCTGDNLPTVHQTTDQRPTLPSSAPNQHVLTASMHKRPPPPSVLLGRGPLPTNSQKHIQYSNIPLSHHPNKQNSQFPSNWTTPTTRFPSNQTTSTTRFPSNQTTPTTRFPSNQTTPTTRLPSNQTMPTKQLPSNQTTSTSRFPSNQTTPSTKFPGNMASTMSTSTRPVTGVQSSNQSVESKIISFLQNQPRPCNTNSIRISVGAATKKDINPVLYAMNRQGIIAKVIDSPPTWKLCPGKGGTLPAKTQNQQSLGRGYQASVLSQMPTPAQSSQLITQAKPIKLAASESSNSKEFFEACFTSINKNPVSALNNYAQKNKSEATFEIISQKTFGKPSFTVAAKLGNRMFTAVTAGNMKEAKRQAADVALREIGQVPTGSDASDGKVDLSNLPSIPQNRSWTHFDRMAALSHQLFACIAPTVSASFAGRKVIACMIMKTSEQDPGRVVSLGAGNRCITGTRISLEGKKVNDSHAEIVARRGLVRILYKEISGCIVGKESIFRRKPNTAKLCLRDGVTFHLYISTAPCGDGALFSPREAGSVASTTGLTREHNPTFTSKQQGILRTKIEDGEGTLPIEFDAPPQTWDGLLQGERLRTMSCSDKICRWNVLGLQGALLNHFIEPIYLHSLTLGYLYDHGHLSRAVCCRLQHKNDLNDRLPAGFHVNHPCIGRVTAYDPPRETEKTNNISINWALGDSNAEVTDGRDGACLTRTNNAPTPSRLCKAAMYGNFRALCRKVPELQHFLSADTYKEAKSLAQDFSRSKQEMKTQFKISKYSQWVSKPMEQDLFNEPLPALDV